MEEALIQIMGRIPSHALSTYVFLEHRSRMDVKVGLTQQEISRATRLSVMAVREALGWLSSPSYQDAHLQSAEISPLIEIVKYSKAHKIILLEPYIDTRREIRFTFEDTDDRRIQVLEAEIRRLASSSKRQRSKLSLYLRGEKQQLIAEIEGDLGRPITIEEAFLLGGICDSFGLPRLRMAWRKHASGLDNPIIALYAMFSRQRFGKMIENENREESDAIYKGYVPDTEPV